MQSKIRGEKEKPKIEKIVDLIFYACMILLWVWYLVIPGAGSL